MVKSLSNVRTTKAGGISAQNKLLLEASKNDFEVASGQTLCISTPKQSDLADASHAHHTNPTIH